MKKGLTELVFILDMSGSMHELEADTIGGFNSMIDKQKDEVGQALVSTVLFNNTCTVIHDRVDITSVPLLSNDVYRARGGTALIDAIGRAIRHIGNVHKYARREDLPEHTLFIITTDGMENASREYDAARARSMIEEKKAVAGWEFLFLGANIDAVRTAGAYGIDPGRAVDYKADSSGTHENFAALDQAIRDVRANRGVSQDWAEGIKANRGKRR